MYFIIAGNTREVHLYAKLAINTKWFKKAYMSTKNYCVMRITVVVLLCTVILVCSCNRSNKESIKEAASISGEFDQFLDAFYKDGLELNPLLATKFGIQGYNHSFPNTLSNEYEAEIKTYYAGYIEKANNFNDEDLSYEQRSSKKIVLWDCQMNLERLSFRQDLIPLDQTWSINHLIGLYASGTSAQPFKTVEDYLNRIENKQQNILDLLNRKHADELMDIDGIIEMTKLAKQTIYQRVSNKSIPFVKIGGALRFRRSEILNWIEQKDITQ